VRVGTLVGMYTKVQYHVITTRGQKLAGFA
jgi:hypothetical protein